MLQVPRNTVLLGTSAGVADERARQVEKIIDQLIGTTQLLRCAGTGRLVKQGISMMHVHVLWLLDEHGDLPMHQVSELLGIAFPNASGLIDRMEERGLVQRAHDPGDRRVVRVRIAASGRAALDEVQILQDDLAVAILGRLDDRQLERLSASLCDFRTALRTEADAHPGLFEAHQVHPTAHAMETGDS
jgi:DNA-binding MarR family transcriptional regulator